MEIDAFAAPVVQYGFAGLGAVLLALLGWLVRRLLELLGECSRVIANNNAALAGVEAQLAENQRLHRDLRDRLLTRPCLLERVPLAVARAGGRSAAPAGPSLSPKEMPDAPHRPAE